MPFDAVLLIAFGGPLALADIRPFLANVLRGRSVSSGRFEAVARHYELFGGVSPIAELTRRQAEGLQARLAASGIDVPVHVGMRNWHPFLRDTVHEMAAAGIRRAIGLIASPYRAPSSCEQYRQNVRDAQLTVAGQGLRPPSVTYVSDWHDRAGFLQANADNVRAARARLPSEDQQRARLVFTAHSIPVSMARTARYESQLQATASRVAAEAGIADWTLVYQSRSGRPEDRWLEPDVLDYLRSAHAGGLRAAILAPIGFIADHVEVLYDLDHEAAAVCHDLGIAMVRAGAVNDHPLFLEALADVVRETIGRYNRGVPLPITVRSPS